MILYFEGGLVFFAFYGFLSRMCDLHEPEMIRFEAVGCSYFMCVVKDIDGVVIFVVKEPEVLSLGALECTYVACLCMIGFICSMSCMI
jgi:hypothetical protein